MTSEELEEMSKTKIENLRKEELVDIKMICLKSKRQDHRFFKYLKQIGNPYCFRCGNVGVQVIFKKTKSSLEMRISDFLIKNKTI